MKFARSKIRVRRGLRQMLISKILQIFSSLIRVISESISRNKQLSFCKICTMSCQSWYNFVSYFPKGVKANLIFFLYRWFRPGCLQQLRSQMAKGSLLAAYIGGKRKLQTASTDGIFCNPEKKYVNAILRRYVDIWRKQ